MSQVRIPAALRPLCGDLAEVTVEGATVREALASLERRCPGIGARLLDERGAVRRYVNIFRNDEDIRFLSSLDTPLSGADRLIIVPAIAGGT